MTFAHAHLVVNVGVVCHSLYCHVDRAKPHLLDMVCGAKLASRETKMSQTCVGVNGAD